MEVHTLADLCCSKGEHPESHDLEKSHNICQTADGMSYVSTYCQDQKEIVCYDLNQMCLSERKRLKVRKEVGSSALFLEPKEKSW
jgi:hypothetical protein